MMHELKCWPQYFSAIVDGSKTFELRKNDRDFRKGDILWLREWNPDAKIYSGREEKMRIGFMLQGQWGLLPDLCCISLLPMLEEDTEEELTMSDIQPATDDPITDDEISVIERKLSEGVEMNAPITRRLIARIRSGAEKLVAAKARAARLAKAGKKILHWRKYGHLGSGFEEDIERAWQEFDSALSATDAQITETEHPLKRAARISQEMNQ